MKNLILTLTALMFSTASFAAQSNDYPHLNCWQNEEFTPIQNNEKVQLVSEHISGKKYEIKIYIHDTRKMHEEYIPVPVRTVTAYLGGDDDIYRFKGGNTLFVFYGGDPSQSFLNSNETGEVYLDCKVPGDEG